MIRTRFLRSVRLVGVIATGVALLAGLGASTVSAAETKSFTGVKNCNNTPSPPDPGGYCVYTQSSLKILLNAKVYYTNPDPAALALGILSSPVALKAADKRGSTASGHCTFYVATVTGLCVFWAGTAGLEGFHATIHVAGPIPDINVYSLTGTYWFDRQDRDGS